MLFDYLTMHFTDLSKKTTDDLTDLLPWSIMPDEIGSFRCVISKTVTVKFMNGAEERTGVLLKRNRKTVLIASENGERHNKVSAGLVSPIQAIVTKS